MGSPVIAENRNVSLLPRNSQTVAIISINKPVSEWAFKIGFEIYEKFGRWRVFNFIH
jgi:hypothetical protein